jgi:anaerobic selenocysteine-containing dehydrogenase
MPARLSRYLRDAVTVKDGVAVKVAGDPTHPFTDGSLCTKVSHYAERTYSPDRLLHPLRRVGPKGKASSSASPGTKRWTKSPRA